MGAIAVAAGLSTVDILALFTLTGLPVCLIADFIGIVIAVLVTRWFF